MVDLPASLQARRNGEGWIAKCPAHDDDTASLSIGRGADGRWLLHCHAGCDIAEVLLAANLRMADLQGDVAPAARRIVAEYSYVGVNGNELYQVVRFEPKDFRQRRRDPVTQQWEWNLRGVERVLYRLDRIQRKPAVFVVEGEKDVHALEALGLTATTNAGGAGKWNDRYALQLVAAGVTKVAILPDNDDAGRGHAEAVSTSCARAGIEARVITLPGLAPKGDVSDWLATHSKDELLALTRGAVLHPATDPVPDRRIKVTRASDIAIRRRAGSGSRTSGRGESRSAN